MADAKSIKFAAEHIARFFKRIAIAEDSQCWNWNLHINKDGYGIFTVEQNAYLSHRYMYELLNGEQPEVVRHTCDNRKCCNPAHLKGGTHRDNVMDRVNKGRSAKGEQNGKARLSASQVLQILADKRKSREIAADYKIDPSTVRHIKNGVIWRHVTGMVDG